MPFAICVNSTIRYAPIRNRNEKEKKFQRNRHIVLAALYNAYISFHDSRHLNDRFCFSRRQNKVAMRSVQRQHLNRKSNTQRARNVLFGF